MATNRFHLRVPWTTIFIAALVALVTYVYALLPAAYKSPLLLWLTSPFNLTYELNNLAYNYVLLVVIFLFVDVYTTGIAELTHRKSLIRNVAILGIISSYAVSTIWWVGSGFPSSGTSILAFCALIFAAAETYSSELIKRISKRNEALTTRLKIASAAFVFLVLILSTILFVYLNGNQFWYIHVVGGLIFIPLFYAYMDRRLRRRVDALEERAEEGVKLELENETKEIEKRAPRRRKTS
jgi:uncharacterized protein YacL